MCKKLSDLLRSEKRAKSGQLSLGKAATAMAEKVVMVEGGSGGGVHGGGSSKYGGISQFS